MWIDRAHNFDDRNQPALRSIVGCGTRDHLHLGRLRSSASGEDDVLLENRCICKQRAASFKGMNTLDPYTFEQELAEWLKISADRERAGCDGDHHTTVDKLFSRQR